MKRWPLVTSFLLFILLCASIAYWGLQLFKPQPRSVTAPPAAAANAVRPELAAAIFGGATGESGSSGNYRLGGVIFSGTPSESIAILSSAGQPLKAVPVGAEVEPGVTVKEVHRTYVTLSDDGNELRVDLPEDAERGDNPGIASPVPVRPSQAATVAPARPQATPPASPSPSTVTAPQRPASQPDGMPAPNPPPSPEPNPPPSPEPNPPPSPEPGQAATQTPPGMPSPPGAVQTAPGMPSTVVNPPDARQQPGIAVQPAPGGVAPSR